MVVGKAEAGWTLTVSGGAQPYAVTLAGNIPGLTGVTPVTVTTYKILSGTPTSPNTYSNLIVRAEDAKGKQKSLPAFSVVVRGVMMAGEELTDGDLAILIDGASHSLTEG